MCMHINHWFDNIYTYTYTFISMYNMIRIIIVVYKNKKLLNKY